MITVAVDAGGADLGPREVAAGAAQAAAGGIGVLLFGPREEIGPVAEEVAREGARASEHAERLGRARRGGRS